MNNALIVDEIDGSLMKSRSFVDNVAMTSSRSYGRIKVLLAKRTKASTWVHGKYMIISDQGPQRWWLLEIELVVTVEKVDCE